MMLFVKFRNFIQGLMSYGLFTTTQAILVILLYYWMSNYIHYKPWDEITYLFPNANCTNIEVWEWKSNSSQT